MKEKFELTLCDWDQPGDIPSWSLNTRNEILDIIDHWLETKKDNKTVFVCFASWKDQTGDPHLDYPNEHTRFLITNSKEEIEIYEFDWIESFSISIYYNIFEFENWEEAFLYCKNLKEGL